MTTTKNESARTTQLAAMGREDAAKWRKTMIPEQVARWDETVKVGGNIRGNKVYDQAFREEWQRLSSPAPVPDAPTLLAQRDALAEALRQIIAAKQAVLMTPGTGVPINLATTIDKAARLLTHANT